MRFPFTPKTIKYPTWTLNSSLLNHHIFLAKERTCIRGTVTNTCVNDGIVDTYFFTVEFGERLRYFGDKWQQDGFVRTGSGHARGKEDVGLGKIFLNVAVPAVYAVGVAAERCRKDCGSGCATNFADFWCFLIILRNLLLNLVWGLKQGLGELLVLKRMLIIVCIEEPLLVPFI